MERERSIGIEALDARKQGVRAIDGLFSVGIIDAVWNEQKLRSAVALADHALGVAQGGG